MDALSSDTVCYLIVKAHEYDAKVLPEGTEEGSDAVDDGSLEILEDRADDPTYAELVEAIDSLNQDQAAELVALFWLGRGDMDIEEWDSAVEEAHRFITEERDPTPYLTGIPDLGDSLAEGLSLMGMDCAEMERAHL